MQIKSHICLSLLWLMVSALALASCSSADEPVTSPDGDGNDPGTYILGLYVLTGDNAGSRAPSGDGEYDRGMGYENYIDMANNDFRVAIFGGSKNSDDIDSWICNAMNPIVTPLESGIGSKYYLLEFEIPASIKDRIHEKDIKLVMMANWRGNYPTLTDGTELGNLFKMATETSAIDYSEKLPGPVVKVDDKIAMFGVCEYQNVTLRLGWSTILEERLHLLRSLAKVEVWAADGTVEMKSVSLTRRNSHAMPMPKGVTSQEDYVKNNYAQDYGAAPSLYPGDIEIDKPLQLVNDADGHYIVYVPEYANIAGSAPREEDSRARLKIEYEDGTTRYIDFAYYKAGDTPLAPSVIDTSKGTLGHFDICRNYWYKFELNKDREVQVQVVPYAEVSLKPDFGLEVDTDRYIPITVEENGKPKVIYYDAKTGIYYGADKVTPVANPFPGLDPVTGHGLLTDSKFNLLYYFDSKEGEYYAPDHNTKIVNPYSPSCYDFATGLTKVCSEVGGYVWYWYSISECKFFAPTNSKHEVTRDIVTRTVSDEKGNENELSIPGLVKFTDADGNWAYWYVPKQEYCLDYKLEGDSIVLQTPIEDPFK